MLFLITYTNIHWNELWYRFVEMGAKADDIHNGMNVRAWWEHFILRQIEVSSWEERNGSCHFLVFLIYQPLKRIEPGQTILICTIPFFIHSFFGWSSWLSFPFSSLSNPWTRKTGTQFTIVLNETEYVLYKRLSSRQLLRFPVNCLLHRISERHHLKRF